MNWAITIGTPLGVIVTAVVAWLVAARKSKVDRDQMVWNEATKMRNAYREEVERQDKEIDRQSKEIERQNKEIEELRKQLEEWREETEEWRSEASRLQRQITNLKAEIRRFKKLAPAKPTRRPRKSQ